MKHIIQTLICDHSGKPDLGERHIGTKLKNIPVLAGDFHDYPDAYPDGAAEMILVAGIMTHRCDDEYDVTITLVSESWPETK